MQFRGFPGASKMPMAIEISSMQRPREEAVEPVDNPAEDSQEKTAGYAGPKLKMEAVLYHDGAEICEHCSHFQQPNQCEVVDGTIAPDGWCVAHSERDKHEDAMDQNSGDEGSAYGGAGETPAA